MSDPADEWDGVDLGPECGAEWDWQAAGARGPQPPCIKRAGHENGPDTDWKRHLHSNGMLRWARVGTPGRQRRGDPMTHPVFAAAHRLAPPPSTRNAHSNQWMRHYVALAVAAHAAFHDQVNEPGPELGYLALIGNTATAAAAALDAPRELVPRLLWDLTPELGALNGEWEEWLVARLDALGVNPADIDGRYRAGDFASPSVRQEVTP